jgi:hypothetical protein
MPDKVIRCRFDLNHEVFPSGFYDVRWFRADDRGSSLKSPASGSSCGTTPSAAGQDLYRRPNRSWLPKRSPSARTRSSRGGWLPKRLPAGTRSVHGERQRPAYSGGEPARRYFRLRRCVPEPIARPAKANAETHTSKDRDRPRGGGNQPSYPETQQICRSTQRNQHTGPVRQCRGPHRGNAEQHITDHEQDRRQSIDDHHAEDDLVTSTLLPAARTGPQ